MTTSVREEITVGELAVRFLVDGQETSGSVAVFEFDVPASSRIAAAHSHDGYEETVYGVEGVLTWTVDGRAIDVAAGEALAFPAASCTSSRTAATSTRRSSPSSLRAFSAPTTSARSARSWRQRPADRPTWPRSERSCVGTV